MKNPLYWCWIVVLIGCAVSIYYGEILMIEPCRMCWYQRMALFPLGLILGIGLYRNDRSMVFYALPLSIFGAAVAFLQAIGIHFPFLRVCRKECANSVFSILGVVTFPDLSAFGLIGITVILFLTFRNFGNSN